MSKKFILQISETQTTGSEQSCLNFSLYCGGLEFASGKILAKDISDLLENRAPVNTAIPISDITAILVYDYAESVSPHIFDEPTASEEWARSSFKQRLVAGYSTMCDYRFELIPVRTRKLIEAVTDEIESLEAADVEYENVPF